MRLIRFIRSSGSYALVLTGLMAGFMMTTTDCLSQSLQSYLQEAAYSNPELRALQMRYQAALQRQEQVAQLPPLQVGIGVPALRPETRLGAQTVMVSASQMFPWFGTLGSTANVEISMTRSAYERISALKLNLYYQVKSAYYQLLLLHEKQKILNENIRLYGALENVALAKVEGGKAIASDVLTIKVRLDDLNQQYRMLENQKKKFNAKLAEAIGKPFIDSVVVDYPLDSLPELDFELESFRARLESGHPLINDKNFQLEASKERQRLNSRLGMPSWGIGLDYSNVSARTDANPEFNGRDILIPKATVSLPLYRKHFKARQEEEQLNQQAISFEKEAIASHLMTSLIEDKVRYDDALLRIDLAEKQKQTTHSAYEILLSEYSGTGMRFDELIQMQALLLRYDMDLVTAYVQALDAVAGIERLTEF